MEQRSRRVRVCAADCRVEGFLKGFVAVSTPNEEGEIGLKMYLSLNNLLFLKEFKPK